MQSALERAVPAKNWLRNIPVFITSNSCGKGKEERFWTLPAAPLACSGAGRAESSQHSPVAPQERKGKRVSFSRGLSQH